MFCKNCGNEIPKNGAYCEKCGALTDELNALAAKVENSNNDNKKKRNIILAIIGAVVLICIFVIPNIAKGGLIFSESTREYINKARYEGKGTSDIVVLAEAYLEACKSSDIEPLRKYLDPERDYSNEKKFIENPNIDFSEIEVSDADYYKILEYTVDGVECMELKYSVVTLSGRRIEGTFHIHKAGEENLWFYGAPAK